MEPLKVRPYTTPQLLIESIKTITSCRRPLTKTLLSAAGHMWISLSAGTVAIGAHIHLPPNLTRTITTVTFGALCVTSVTWIAAALTRTVLQITTTHFSETTKTTTHKLLTRPKETVPIIQLILLILAGAATISVTAALWWLTGSNAITLIGNTISTLPETWVGITTLLWTTLTLIWLTGCVTLISAALNWVSAMIPSLAVMTIEKTGATKTIRRTWKLTSGRRGHIFGGFLTLNLIFTTPTWLTTHLISNTTNLKTLTAGGLLTAALITLHLTTLLAYQTTVYTDLIYRGGKLPPHTQIA